MIPRMRKLIWLFLIVAVTTSLLAAPGRRRALGIRAPESVATQYRVDAGRTALTTENGPRWLDTLAWERPLQGPVRGLVFDRGVLYAGGFGGVYAVNPATGADFWIFSAPNVQFSPVAILNDTVYVSGGSVFYALNRASGALLWSLDAGAGIDATSPLIVNGVAYVGSTAGTVHAIDLASHTELWRRNVGSAVRTHLVASKGLLLAVTDGALRALRIHDGEERWSKAGQWSSAAADDKLVYAGLDGGAFHALELQTGKVEWTYADPDHPSVAWSAPAISQDILTVGNASGWLYTIDADTGARRLMMEQISPLPVTEPLVSANGRVYFGTGNDPAAPMQPVSIYVIDLDTGVESQRYLYGHVTGGVAVANEVMFVHDSTNTLSAFTN